MENKNTAPPIASEPKVIKGKYKLQPMAGRRRGPGEAAQQQATLSRALLLEDRWLEDISA